MTAEGRKGEKQNMKNFKGDRKNSFTRAILLPFLLFLVTIAVFIGGAFYFERMNNAQSINLLRQSVRRAMVQCYAMEGIYPSQVEYLEKYYGLTYDHEKYFIDYEGFAANVMPNVEVFERY